MYMDIRSFMLDMYVSGTAQDLRPVAPMPFWLKILLIKFLATVTHSPGRFQHPEAELPIGHFTAAAAAQVENLEKE